MGLSGNNLKKIDDVFGELKELRRLSLAANELTTLHDSICSLEKLWKLDIYRLPLKGKLPPSFAKLKHLTFLRIDGTGIKKKLSAYLKDFKYISTFRCDIDGMDKYIESDNSAEIKEFITNNT